MIILISNPEKTNNEAQIVNQILAEYSKVIFHLRKPDYSLQETEKLIISIQPQFHHRIVIHQHFSLATTYNLKGIHLKEADRNINSEFIHAVSTSFHSLKDALREGNNFEYFFCSPVFQSISKPNYTTSEVWEISSETEKFRQKAFALGGIDEKKFQQVREKGFKNVAFLGAVWSSEDPLSAFDKLVQAFDV